MATIREQLLNQLASAGWVCDTEARTKKFLVLKPGPEGTQPLNGLLLRPAGDPMRMYIGKSGALRYGSRGVSCSFSMSAGMKQRILQSREPKAMLIEVCSYPHCKCIVSTSTSQPEPTCPLGRLQ